MSAQLPQSNITIHHADSLPPQIDGPETGKLSFRVLSCRMLDGAQPVGAKMRFVWWGHTSPLILKVPWKLGSGGEEVLFPLKADIRAVKEYMDDMSEMNVEFLDAKNKCFGKAAIPLSKFARSGLEEMEPVDIIKPLAPGSHKRVIGQLKLGMRANFYPSTNVNSEVSSSSSRSSSRSGINGGVGDKSILGRGQTPPAVDKSPVRPSIKDSARKVQIEPSARGVLSSFQKNEALVHTDNSDKFSQWPNNGKKGGEEKLVDGAQARNKKGIEKNAKDVTFVSSEASGLGAAPQPMGLSRPIRPKIMPQTKVKKTGMAGDDTLSSSSVASSSHGTPSVAEATPKRPAVASSVRGAAARRRESTMKAKGSKGSPGQQEGSSKEMSVDELLDDMAGLNKEPEPAPEQESYLDSVLRKAEGLLNTVTKASALSKKESPWSGTEEQLVGKVTFIGKPTVEDMKGQINPEELGAYFENQDRKENAGSNIDWLVQGVPEIYDEGVDMDDEALQRIMKEAGPPPSQLLFPSFFETAQKVMERLQQIKRMNLSFRHIVIHSQRYGVRKDGAFLVAKPPVGVAIGSGKLSSQLALTELRSRALVKKDKRMGLLDDYFSGKEDLVFKQVSWPCKLNDGAVRRWIAGEDDGCLYIELHSFLSSNSKKHANSNSSVFGFAKIPLGSILTSETFDAVVNAEIFADEETVAIFTNRIQSMPNGTQLRLLKPLGPSMGLLTLRLALSTDENAPEEFDFTQPRSRVEAKRLPPTGKHSTNTVLAIPAVEPEDNVARYGTGTWTHESVSQGEKSLDAARDFVPKESREAALEDQSMEVEEGYRDTVEGNYLTGNAAIVVHTVHIDKDNFMEQASKWCADKSEVTKPTVSNYSDLQCHVCYKVVESEEKKTSVRETMTSRSAILNDATDTVDIPIFDASIYKSQNLQDWKPPIFEVWLSDGSMSCKVLLGIGKHEGEFVNRGSMPLRIKIENIFTGSVVGSLDVSFVLGRKSSVVDASVNSVLMDRKFSWLSQGEVHISELPLPLPMPRSSKKGPIPEIPWKEPQTMESKESQLPPPPSLPESSCNANEGSVGSSGASWHDMAYGGKTASISPEASMSPPRSPFKTSGDIQNLTTPPSKDITSKFMEIRRSTNASSMDMSFDVHTLDIVITSTCSETIQKYFPQEAPNIPGCRLVYSLDKSLISFDIKEESPNEGNTDGLWWDKENSVGNTRTRHLLKVPTKSIGSFEFMHASCGIEFSLHVLDEEGNIRDAANPLCIFYLPYGDFFDLLKISCSGRLVPLISSSSEGKRIELVLDVSHRVEPSMVRQSAQSSVARSSTSLRYSVSSIDKPNSISGTIPIQVQQPLLDFRPREAILFDVVVEEIRGLLENDRKPDTLLAFCGCSAGYMQDIDSLTYSVGPESCVTSIIPFDDKVLSWKDATSSIQIPLLSTSDCKSLVRSLALKVSVYFRTKLSSLAQLPKEAYTRGYQIGDQFICSAVVDLSLLASGFPEICGWYDLKDSFQKSRGQVKVKIKFSDENEGLDSSFNSIATSSTNSEDSHKQDRSDYTRSPESREEGNDNRPNELRMIPGLPDGSDAGQGKSRSSRDPIEQGSCIEKDSTMNEAENTLVDKEAIDLALVLNSPASNGHPESNETTLVPDSSLFSPDKFEQVTVAAVDLDVGDDNDVKISKVLQNVHDLDISIISEGSARDALRDVSNSGSSSSSGSEKESSANRKDSSPFLPPPQPPMADPAEESLFSVYDDSQSEGTDSVVDLLDNSVMSNSMVSMFDSYLTLDRDGEPLTNQSLSTPYREERSSEAIGEPQIQGPLTLAPILSKSPAREKRKTAPTRNQQIIASNPLSPLPISGIAMIDIAGDDVLSPVRAASDADDVSGEGYNPILSTSMADYLCSDSSDEVAASNAQDPSIIVSSSETLSKETFNPIDSSVDHGEVEPLNTCPFKAYSGTGNSAETQPLNPKKIRTYSAESDVLRASLSSSSSSSSSSTSSTSESKSSSSSSPSTSSSSPSSSSSDTGDGDEKERSVDEIAEKIVSPGPYISNIDERSEKVALHAKAPTNVYATHPGKDDDDGNDDNEDGGGVQNHKEDEKVEGFEQSFSIPSLRVNVAITNVLGDEYASQPSPGTPFAHYISPSASSVFSTGVDMQEDKNREVNIDNEEECTEATDIVNGCEIVEVVDSPSSGMTIRTSDEEASPDSDGIFFLTSPNEKDDDRSCTSIGAEFAGQIHSPGDADFQAFVSASPVKTADVADKIAAISAGDNIASDGSRNKVKAVIDPEKIESIVTTPLSAVVAAAREAREARERVGSARSRSPHIVPSDADGKVPPSPWISDKRVNAMMDQAFLIDDSPGRVNDHTDAIISNENETNEIVDISDDNAQEIVIENGQVLGSPESSLTGRGLGLSLIQPQITCIQQYNDENQRPHESPVSRKIRRVVGEELQKLSSAANRNNIESQVIYSNEKINEQNEPVKISRQASSLGLVSSDNDIQKAPVESALIVGDQSQDGKSTRRILKRKPPIFPGRRKIFVDQETERVSRIMMGNFHEYASNR